MQGAVFEAGTRRPSACGSSICDLLNDLFIHWADLGSVEGSNFAFPVNKVFAEIPAGFFPCLSRQPTVKWVLVIATHGDLFKHPERYAVVLLAEGCNILVAAGFLPEKIVSRKSKYG